MNDHLSLDGFQFRPFIQDDAASFAAAVRESGDNLAKWMQWAHSNYSEAEALAWFQTCEQARDKDAAYEFGIFTQYGEFVGGCGLNQFNVEHRFCNLGYWIRQPKQRQGAATAAVSVLCDFAFKRLRLARVEIVVVEENNASVGVAKKAGGVFECLARNRLILRGKPVSAHVFSFINESYEVNNDAKAL